jgi:putative DNA primase/helicase
MTFEEVISRFRGPRRSNGQGGYLFRCPAHADKEPSLSVSPGNGSGPLFNCFGGCKTEDVLAAVDLTWQDVLPSREPRNPVPRAISRAPGKINRYEIRDPSGNTIAVHVREDRPEGKNLWWELPDGTRGLNGLKLASLPLYGIDRIGEDGEMVVVEGEKAADALRSNGIAAVGTVTGASGTPGDEAIRSLLGRPVFLWPDNDDAGRKHMDRIEAALLRLGHRNICVITWKGAPPKGDAADLVGLEGWRDDFDALMDEARAVETPAAHEPENPLPLFTQCMADIEVKPVTWLWKERLPLGKLVVIAGEPGLGKSRLALSIAATTSTGGYWPRDEGCCEKGEILILNFEDDPADTTVPRLIAEGADLSAIHQLIAVPDEKGRRAFDVSRDTDRLAKYLELHPKMRLVVVDPITACLGQTDSHKNSEVRAALHPLAEVAQRFGVCVLAISHLNKGTGMRAIHRVCGSIAFTAAARVVYAVARDEQDPEGKRRLFVPVKNNLGNDKNGLSYGTVVVPIGLDIDAPKIVWGEEVTITADEALAPPPEEERGALEEACEFLTALLAEGPVTVEKVKKDARGAGIAAVTLKRAKRALKVKTEKTGMRGGWEWSLP